MLPEFQRSRFARLKRRRLIRALFDRSRSDVRSIARGCIRIVYRVASFDEVGVEVPVQAGVSPGRKARNAVQRNRIKRILRDVYRHHQHRLAGLFQDRSDTLTLMILFRGDPIHDETRIRHDLPALLDQLIQTFIED